MRRAIENRQDRLALAEDAGWGRISPTSVAAGILVGYGAFAVLAGLTAAILGALNVDVDLSGEDLRRTGTVGGIVLGLVLLASWYFGAYTAGRMARRAGTTHGIVVFFIGVLVAVAAASLVEALDATDDVVDGLERLGVPTTADQWSDIGTVAGIASLVGMLLGCLLGGTAGERWHTKLMARALDPNVGPEAGAAEARKYAAAAENRATRARDRRREVDVTEGTEALGNGRPKPLVEAKAAAAASRSDGGEDPKVVGPAPNASKERADRPAAKARDEHESTAS